MTGTGKLIRLILRRDRVLMPLWVLILGLVPLSYVTSFRTLFSTDAERKSYAQISEHNATFVALYGRLTGDSLGHLVAWRAGFIPIIVGLISLLTVIRHTRTEEESGRRELIGSTVTGRHAGLAAALITTCVANLLLALVLTAGLAGQDMAAGGALALGLEFAFTGWIFAAVGAVAAQLTSSASSARGIGILVIGVAYALRVAGDLSYLSDGALSWLSWLSPLGLVQQIDPYGAERWWVLAVAAALTALFVAAAIALSGRRDVGAGLLPQRLGPATSTGLRSPLALAWRLHRGLLVAWTVGFALLGLVFGNAMKDIGDMLNDNPKLADIFSRLGGKAALVDTYVASVMGIMGLIAAGYAIQSTLKLRAEEAGGRAEPVLGTAVGRIRWAAGHLLFALLGPAVALTVAGLVMGSSYGLVTGEPRHEIARTVGAALMQLPAVWVLTAVTVALFGAAPRLAPAAWGALFLCLLISLVGGAIQLNQRLLDISPFTHIPKTTHDLSVTPLAWLAGIAVVLGAAGLAALRRRDLPVG